MARTEDLVNGAEVRRSREPVADDLESAGFAALVHLVATNGWQSAIIGVAQGSLTSAAVGALSPSPAGALCAGGSSHRLAETAQRSVAAPAVWGSAGVVAGDRAA
jgi:hypothetical protein